MIATILAALMTLGQFGRAHDIERRDYFETECAKYLILEEPDFLEREERDDLELLLLNLRARIHVYQHPLDRVMAKLVEHELLTRDAIRPRLLRVVR